VKVHPGQLKVVVFAIVTPAKVIVLDPEVAVKVMPHVIVLTSPLYNVRLPAIAKLLLQASVKLPVKGAEIVKSRQFILFAVVTVYPVALERESKKTSSLEVG